MGRLASTWGKNRKAENRVKNPKLIQYLLTGETFRSLGREFSFKISLEEWTENPIFGGGAQTSSNLKRKNPIKKLRVGPEQSF